MTTTTIGSVFSGAGGLDIAAEIDTSHCHK
jgi:site-specific DNA-cytosine methylase